MLSIYLPMYTFGFYLHYYLELSICCAPKFFDPENLLDFHPPIFPNAAVSTSHYFYGFESCLEVFYIRIITNEALQEGVLAPTYSKYSCILKCLLDLNGTWNKNYLPTKLQEILR